MLRSPSERGRRPELGQALGRRPLGRATSDDTDEAARPRRRGTGTRASRTRRKADDGTWRVTARIERFVEPAILHLLALEEAHGYQLADDLAALAPNERVDFGNLYRLLRSLEEEGLVTSSWRSEVPGPAKRSYAITDTGRELLAAWVEALRATERTINELIRKHEET